MYRILNVIARSVFLFIFLSYNTLVLGIQDDRISLNFYQSSASSILQTLADYQQMNLVIVEGGDNIQTIKLNDVSWRTALDIVMLTAKLQYVIDGNLLIVSKKPDPSFALEQQRQQQKDIEQQLPLTYATFSVNHADIQSIVTMITQQQILSERGKVFIDNRTNSVILHDTDQRVDEIRTLINHLDKPVPQVHISAHIVTMSSESANELGIKWNYNGSSSQLLDSFNINMGVANPSAAIGFNLAKRSGNLLNLELSALEAENQLEIIASPNLFTSHQHTASIKQGTEIPYEVSSGNNGSTAIEFKQAVLGLEVTPRILANNQMELILYITQNTAGRSIKRSDGGEALAIDTQEIRTQVLVNDGETLILGGIFQQSYVGNQQSVPGVSKIPVLGELFKYEGSKQQKRELVIFITPHLVNF